MTEERSLLQKISEHLWSLKLLADLLAGGRRTADVQDRDRELPAFGLRMSVMAKCEHLYC